MMKLITNWVEFKPGDLERLTGLPLATQRNWRRRGFLPPRETGHARFHPLEAATAFLMMELARFGVGPTRSSAACIQEAPSLLRFVLDDPKAWSLSGSQADKEATWAFVHSTEGVQHLDLLLGLKVGANRFSLLPAEGELVTTNELGDLRGRPGTHILLHYESLAQEFLQAADQALIEGQLRDVGEGSC